MYTFFGNISQSVRNTVKRIVNRDVKEKTFVATNGQSAQIVDSLLLSIHQSYADFGALINDVNTYRNYYLVDLVLNLYADEALAVDPSTDELFRIVVDPEAQNSKEIQRQVDYLLGSFDIETILRDNIIDMLFYNEYNFKLVFDPNKKLGIVNILDGTPAGRIVSVNRRGMPIKFYELDAHDIIEREPYEFWHFQLFPQKVRIINNKDRRHLKINPYSIQHGRPFIASILPQLKELITLEVTSVARSISDLMRKSMVNVSAPESLDPEQLTELTKYYENLINRSSMANADPSSLIGNISQMMGDVSRIKVIPSDSQRGQISSIDLKNSADDDTQQKIKDKREIILGSFGVPYEVLFNNEGSSLNLRSYTSLQKRIKTIQNKCANSIKQLIAIQCASVGVKIEKLEDITVNFLNSINVTELDRLEFQDTKMQSIMDFYDRVKGIMEDETMSEFIDKKELIKYLSDNFRSIKGAEKIIKYTETTKGASDGTTE